MINLIAEIGVNWDNLQTAADMIREAKRAQAQYVKFQLFNEETISASPRFQELTKLILDERKVKLLRKVADENKIGFILTPMYPDAMEIANKYADMIKIRYADHENQLCIDAALETGKTLLISAPTKPIGPLAYNARIRWLYCLPRYPPEPQDFNIELASSCHGFSSHYPHIVFDIAYAVNRVYKECFIEKHVMLDSRLIQTPDCNDCWMEDPSYQPIDKAVSITFEQLHTLAQDCKMIEEMKRRPRINI